MLGNSVYTVTTETWLVIYNKALILNRLRHYIDLLLTYLSGKYKHV